MNEPEELPHPPPLTTARTIRRGELAGAGTERGYYRLAAHPGEPHLRRLDLVPAAGLPSQRTSLLHLAHLTDLHVLDTGSPGRFEFVERLHGPEELRIILPAYCPQEILHTQAVEAMLRTIDAIEASPITGAPINLAMITGDLIDNAQSNELQQALRLLGGGTIVPFGLSPSYEGVAAAGWGDSWYWHPDDIADEFKDRWGFPRLPGLLESAAQPFAAHGLSLPWLSCYGNHDARVVGAAIPNEAYERIVAGGQKPHSFPVGFDPLSHLDRFIHRPDLFLAGPWTAVTPDPTRRSSTRREFVETHRLAGGTPTGHGFGPSPTAGDLTYYIADISPLVRLIVLDTVNLAGDFQGSIGRRQFAWLEERLIEVHSRYQDATGNLITTANSDRLVIICSHHGSTTLINDRTDAEHEDDLPRVLGPQLQALLHRFPNVVLWLNGHTHRNQVRCHRSPSGPGAGFWEVTTSSLIDWPCQSRLVEIVANGDDTLSIVCTMIDHAGPINPAATTGLWQLAALHRELAANDPHAGIESGLAGDSEDRNVELVLPMPFPLDVAREANPHAGNRYRLDQV